MRGGHERRGRAETLALMATLYWALSTHNSQARAAQGTLESSTAQHSWRWVWLH